MSRRFVLMGLSVAVVAGIGIYALLDKKKVSEKEAPRDISGEVLTTPFIEPNPSTEKGSEVRSTKRRQQPVSENGNSEEIISSVDAETLNLPDKNLLAERKKSKEGDLKYDYDAIFAQEPIDPAWSNRYHQNILNDSAAIFSEGNVTVKSIECRTTICKVSLEAAEPSLKVSALQFLKKVKDAEWHKDGAERFHRMKKNEDGYSVDLMLGRHTDTFDSVRVRPRND